MAFVLSFALARRTNPKEFKVMGDGREPAPAGDSSFQIVSGTFFNLNHQGALTANQVMMMTVAARPKNLITRNSIPKIKPLYEPKLLQQVHGALNTRQITAPTLHLCENFAD